jgi:hypothetical protein
MKSLDLIQAGSAQQYPGLRVWATCCSVATSLVKSSMRYQKVKSGRLGSCLIKLGFLTEEILHSVLSASSASTW